MNSVILIPASIGNTGIIAKKSKGIVSNSIELRKVSASGRDLGCMAVVAGSTFNVIAAGTSYRNIVSNPHPETSLQELVNKNKTALSELLNLR